MGWDGGMMVWRDQLCIPGVPLGMPKKVQTCCFSGSAPLVRQPLGNWSDECAQQWIYFRYSHFPSIKKKSLSYFLFLPSPQFKTCPHTHTSSLSSSHSSGGGGGQRCLSHTSLRCARAGSFKKQKKAPAKGCKGKGRVPANMAGWSQTKDLPNRDCLLGH